MTEAGRLVTSDGEMRKLRAALDRLAEQKAADLLNEARAEARSRVRTLLADSLTESMLAYVAQAIGVQASNVPAASLPQRPGHDSAPPVQVHGADGLGTYVYGVLATAEATQLAPMNGIDPAHLVTTVAAGDLAALVSAVPLREFDELRLREHLSDMNWVERVARAHEGVLDAAGRQVTVIPMRMCSIYRDEAGVRSMLEREAPAMRRALELLRDKAEWGGK